MVSSEMKELDTSFDWIEIEVHDRFSFQLPSNLKEVDIKGIDSFVRRWESQDLIVHFDYGLYSDPLTTYTKKKLYKATLDNIDGHLTSIISFQKEDGWYFMAVHFHDLGRDRWGRIVKLTFIVENSQDAKREVPLRIVKSISFR
jgi:hypothetical protein